MPSPRQQPPERARLRAFIESRLDDLDLTWRELVEASGVPYETIRRVRTGDRPITRDTRTGLEDGLQWERGSIRTILDGGDPTPLDTVPAPAPARHVLDTPVGRVAYDIVRDIDLDDGLSGAERAQLETALAERIRGEYLLFYEAQRRDIERNRTRERDA